MAEGRVLRLRSLWGRERKGSETRGGFLQSVKAMQLSCYNPRRTGCLQDVRTPNVCSTTRCDIDVFVLIDALRQSAGLRHITVHESGRCHGGSLTTFPSLFS